MNEQNSYIYGRNAVIEAMNSGASIEKIFIVFGAKGDVLKKIYASAKRQKISCVTHDKGKFTKLERSVCPKGAKSQGVIALVRPFETYSIGEFIAKAFEMNKKPVVVILDGITDPQNLGAIARSAECSGASGIILTERHSAPITPVAIKTSAGALEHLPITRVSSLIQALDKLKEEGFWVIGTEMNADKFYTEENYDTPVALVIGSEGSGMKPGTVKHCDILVKIPLYGKINSLNASVSAGILLYEIARKRGF